MKELAIRLFNNPRLFLMLALVILSTVPWEAYSCCDPDCIAEQAAVDDAQAYVIDAQSDYNSAFTAYQDAIANANSKYLIQQAAATAVIAAGDVLALAILGGNPLTIASALIALIAVTAALAAANSAYNVAVSQQTSKLLAYVDAVSQLNGATGSLNTAQAALDACNACE